MKRLMFLFVLGCIVIAACDDFFEEDLEGKVVTLIAPGDGLATSNSSFTFWWEEVDGASKYNLQIVSPDFNTIEKLVLDTNISKNQFDVQLYPGNFQWRVKAFNSASETVYTTYTLSVDSSLDLSGAEVILSLPANQYATNDTNVNFSWQQVYNANEYRIKIRENNWASGEVIISDFSEDNSYEGELPEGFFVWGVQALNDNSASPFQTRELYVDLTNPQKPSMISPSQGATTGTDVTFTWSRADDSGSPVSDSLIVSTDSTFTGDMDVAIFTTSTSYSANFDVAAGSSQKYYWRVRSIDAAGNKSDVINFRRFTVKNEK